MKTSLRITSSSVSDRGLSDKRPENEDSFIELGSHGIYAVADGVGGAKAGEIASQMAVEILAEAFTNVAAGTDAENVMQAAIERANSAIHQMSQELPQLANMATTIVALHLDGNIATIGHVGDSRLYRLDREGVLHRETDDHSVVAEEVRAGRMTEEQASNHPSRNIISRALGADPTVQADLRTIMVDAGTAFLICSDGITRHVGENEIKGVLTFGGTPEEICDYLKGLCYERGAEDNLTAVVVKIGTAKASANGAAPVQPLPDAEESTIATPRTPIVPAFTPRENDTLLELEQDAAPEAEIFADTIEIPRDIRPDRDDDLDDTMIRELSPEEIAIASAPTEVPPFVDDDPFTSHAAGPQPEIRTVEPKARVRDERPDTPGGGFTMFGQDGKAETTESSKPGGLAKMATTLGLLLLGAFVGLGGYHLFILPQMQQTPALATQTEMRSGNVPLTAFEESRRTVDRSPAEALQRLGADPRDAEDFFLVGRAHMLLGNYPQAREAFMASKQKMSAGDVDQNNTRNIETDIAIGLAVMNDSTVQGVLRKELEGNTNPALPVNVNRAP